MKRKKSMNIVEMHLKAKEEKKKEEEEKKKQKTFENCHLQMGGKKGKRGGKRRKGGGRFKHF